MNPGFYKYDNGEWLYGPNAIYAPDFTLLKENKDDYTYPIDGWVWYDDQPYAEPETNESI